MKDVDLELLTTVNAGGVLGAIAGGVVGFDAGLVGGLVASHFSGNDEDVLATAWAGAGAGFYGGAIAPTP